MKQAREREPQAFTLHLKWKHDGMLFVENNFTWGSWYYALSMTINWVKKINN
jgi:hypothetical protein